MKVISNISWKVTSDSEWLIATPASGSNNGTVQVSVTEHTNPNATRTGKLTISDAAGVLPDVELTVVQNAAGTYTFSANPNSVANVAAGGRVGISVVITTNAASYEVTNASNWISITSGATGQSGDTIVFTVAAYQDTSVNRTGGFTINLKDGNGNTLGTQSFTVSQVHATPVVSHTIELRGTNPTQIANGQTATFYVDLGNAGDQWSCTVPANCEIVSQSADNVVVRNNSNTPGNTTGTIAVALTGYPSATDSDTITLIGVGDSYSIEITELGEILNGGSASVTIVPKKNGVVDSSLAWTLNETTGAQHFTPSANSGTGQASVSITNDLGTSGTVAAQNAKITVSLTAHGTVTAERSFTLQGHSESPYVSVPQQVEASEGAQSLNINVSANTNFTVSAESSAPWITVVNQSGTSQTQQIGISLSNNTSGSQRNGNVVFTYTSGGVQQTVSCTVKQSACALAATLSKSNFAPTADSAVLAVTYPGKGWRISCPSWITAEESTGSGNTSVNLTIAAGSGSQRVGTITVYDSVNNAFYVELPVTQSAPTSQALTYTLNWLNAPVYSENEGQSRITFDILRAAFENASANQKANGKLVITKITVEGYKDGDWSALPGFNGVTIGESSGVPQTAGTVNLDTVSVISLGSTQDLEDEYSQLRVFAELDVVGGTYNPATGYVIALQSEGVTTTFQNFPSNG